MLSAAASTVVVDELSGERARGEFSLSSSSSSSANQSPPNDEAGNNNAISCSGDAGDAVNAASHDDGHGSNGAAFNVAPSCPYSALVAMRGCSSSSRVKECGKA